MSLNRNGAVEQPTEGLIIRQARIITMDPELGDLDRGDIHVVDGRIVAIAPRIDAPGADVIDAGGMIAMPGFVDTHWHMATSLWRGLAHDASGYMALQRLGAVYTEDDHYAAVRYAALEAINAGVTTCHNWAHLLRGPADAHAEARALVDAGIRARFGYGQIPVPGVSPIDTAQLGDMQAWIDDNGADRMDLGLVSHVTENLATEVTAARARGLKSIGQHVDLSQHIGLIGPDFIFTHGPGTPLPLVQLLAARGVKIALCPTTDPLIGAGLPPASLFLEGGVPFEHIGISVDVTAQAGVDPFAMMRTVMNSTRIDQQAGATFFEIALRPADPDDPTNGLMVPREVLAMATINGARVLGLESEIGSLTPGKRADVILVRADDPNMMPVDATNVSFQLVQNAQPSNVDTVIVDGRVLKRSGQVLGTSPAEIVAAAAAAQRGLLQRGGVSVDPLL